MLEDGIYDVVVVDAEGISEGAIALEMAVIGGQHKGEIIRLTAAGIERDPLDLLAVPATLTVRDGVPHVRLEG